MLVSSLLVRFSLKFLSVPCSKLSWLHVIFLLHNIALYRIVLNSKYVVFDQTQESNGTLLICQTILSNQVTSPATNSLKFYCAAIST